MTACVYPMGGDGPPVVLIHGFGADRMTWMFLVPLLSEEFSVFVVDLPGHGDASNNVSDGSIDALSDAVADIVPHVPIRIIGHSMGGAIALELARRGLVSHAVLLAPAGLGASVALEFLNGFPEIASVDDASRILGLLVSKKRLVTPQMANYVMSGLAKEDRRSALRKIAARLIHLNPDIPSTVPTTVIWGAEDKVNLPPDRLSCSDYHLLDGVGHMPHVEAVSKVTPIIIDALEG